MFSVLRSASTRATSFLSKELKRNPFNIAILDDYQRVAQSMADWSRLPENTSVIAYHEHFYDDRALVRELYDKQAVVVMRERTRFHAGIFEALPNLKLLVTSGPKNEAIDIKAAEKHGVVVSGTRSLKEPPAELTIGLMLALARNIPQESAALRNGGLWQSTVGISLNGKTLGVVGLGHIGAMVARVAQTLGMKVIAWSQNLTAERTTECGVILAASKQDLLKTSDVVSIHVRLSDRTRDLLRAEDLELMKPMALLINTSRAEIVNQAALVSALNSGRILGAAADVFEEEPLPKDHPLRTARNFIGTPHLGYVTEANYRGYFSEAVEDIEAYLAGKPVRELYPSKGELELPVSKL